MNKASKALRRSSIRLKSFSCGHSELNLIISDMKEVRSAAKHFADAQETVYKDLFKWASKERNEAIRESCSHICELNRLWTEVQNDFIEQLNKFKYTFEMILEGEMSLDKLREHLAACELRENRLKKDLLKNTKKNNLVEARLIEPLILDARSSIKSTQIEISERTHENEAVKVIRLKEGLLKLSESYSDLAHKSNIIFDGSKRVAASLPELDQTRGMHNIRYRGSEIAKQTVAQVKESVKTYRPVSEMQPGAPPTDCPPPPPYSSPPPFYPGFVTYTNGWRVSSISQDRYDLPPGEDYEQDMVGAIGGARI